MEKSKDSLRILVLANMVLMLLMINCEHAFAALPGSSLFE